MTSIKEKAKKGLKPYIAKDALLGTGSQVGGTIVGFGASAVINRQANPQGKIWLPLGMFAAGLLGVHYFTVNDSKSWMVKAGKSALAATSIYGGLKTMDILTSPGPAGGTGTGNGISSFIPETVKDKIRQFLPTINGLGEYPTGYANDPLSSMMGLNYAQPGYPIEATTFQGPAEGEFQAAEVL